MNRKTWSGQFVAQRRGERLWLIGAAGPPRVDVYLIDARLEPSPESGTIERIDIDWIGDTVDVALTQGASTRRFAARAAFVHRMQPDLYEALPLEVFGPRSQRFWKKIFLLVRIPGGRVLLEQIARRARA